MIMLDSVTNYANNVLNNEIIAGRYVKLACERHMDDLKRQGNDDFPYIFNADEANRIIHFAENLILDEGEEKTSLFLYDFQKFILGSLMGWVHKDTGYRRFRELYMQVGRQNGKSVLQGILATYLSGFDGYRNGLIGCIANNEKQSKIVWKEVKKFINADKDLKQCFKVVESENKIISKITGTEIQAFSNNVNALDGYRCYLGICDELHMFRDNQKFKLLQGGQGKLKQALLSAITTAGMNLNSFCKEHYDYCIKVLEGLETKETQFIYIAQMDKNDDIWNYKNWIKANPLKFTNLDNSFNMDSINSMKDIAMEAKSKGGQDLVDFMTKQLNIWVEFSDKKYINLANLKKCESNLTLSDMRGKTAICGLDLSSGGDLTSLALIFNLENNKKFIESHSFIPEFKVLEHETTDLAPYRTWINSGLLTVTSGFKTDYKYIISYLKDLMNTYNINIQILGYDNHNASAFLNDLECLGVDSIEVIQSCRNLNDATVDFKLSIDENTILYNKNNKLLIWSMANALVTSNSFGEIKIDKNYSQSCKRIDPVDSVIDAWHVMLREGFKFDLNKKILADDFYM